MTQLTGKAKEDFLKWVYSEYDYKYEHLKDFYPLHLLDGLIIEWFDSLRTLNKKRGVYKFKQLYLSSFKEMENNHSISEIQNKAIKKANEIYNIQQ